MDEPAGPIAAPEPTAAQAPAQQPGLFERHAWLIPVCGIASVVAAFTAMILLTWIAGGGTLFDR